MTLTEKEINFVIDKLTLFTEQKPNFYFSNQERFL